MTHLTSDFFSCQRIIRCHLHANLWINEVPLNGNKDAPAVDYIAYSLCNKGKKTYHNGWVTNIVIEDTNVQELVRTGRSRWRIENEVFTTVKNHGYHIEHTAATGRNTSPSTSSS